MSAGKGDAYVKVGADASAAVRAAEEVKSAWQKTGSGIASSMANAATSTVSSLANVALAQGQVSFANQHQQVRDFEAATAHLSVASVANLGKLRNEIEATGVAFGKRPAEVAAWASEVGQLRYSFDGAVDSMRGIEGLGALTGRSASQYKGLAVELATVGKVSGDTTHAVGVLTAQAEKLGVVGGVAAFADQVQGLGDTISHFAVKSEADFLRVTAAAAGLGKGLNPQAAQRVQQSALGYVASNTLGIERYLGHSVTDEHGQVKDAMGTLQEYVEKVKRQYGKNAHRNLTYTFGAETASALENADWGAMKSAASIAPSTKPQEAVKQYLATDAGHRDVAQAELAKSSRDLLGSSSKLGQAADALQKFAAGHPVASTAVSSAAGGAIGAVGAGIAKAAIGSGGASKGVLGALGAGSALSWAGGALVAGAGGYGLGSLADWGLGLSDRLTGVNQDKHRAKWLYNPTIKDEQDASDVDADAALAKRVAAIRAQNAAKRATADVSPGAGDGVKQALAALQSNKPLDPEAFGKAVAAALQSGSGIKVEVTNASDTPVTATQRTAASSRSGRQH